MGFAFAGVADLVGHVGAVADGLARLGGSHLVANSDFQLTFQQVEVFNSSRRMGIGFPGGPQALPGNHTIG